MKVSYSFPRIEDTLDCLNGAVGFTALDLKSGYWKVKMDEVPKSLITFTVVLVGFYECECMPFGLVNAPATFQKLIETCLGELLINWCLIHLDDITGFSKK